MSMSSTPENRLQFICEPQQVLPFATAFSVLNPSTKPILCEPSTPPSPCSPPTRRGRRRCSLRRGRLQLHQGPPPPTLLQVPARRPPLLRRSHPPHPPGRHPRRRSPQPPPPQGLRRPAPPGTTPAALAAALRARFGPDSVEYALVAPGGLCAIVLFRRLCDARRALFSPVGEGLLGAGLFLPLDFLTPPAGRDRRAVVARFAGPRSPERLAELGALLARYGAVAEGPAWAGAWVSGTDGRRTPEPSAAYVVYEDAAATDAALADNPSRVVASRATSCERVLHITDPEPHPPPSHQLSMLPPPPPTAAVPQEGPRRWQGTNQRRRLEFDDPTRLTL
uniref:Uncharacterized protein n=1 Tax=Ananas comosus var. bracteatus TaxID=296719 RepID=A0A6V7QH74_ANACO|nr:unnamed protein product [Ananas comosus var. bracteatus]